MNEEVCLACMSSPIRPHHVICRSCYERHADLISSLKQAPLDAAEVRRKLWGQRYTKNRSSRNRTRIAYAAYQVAAQGDDEILIEVRQGLRDRPVKEPERIREADTGEPAESSYPQNGDGLGAEAAEVAFLESKLGEDRATGRQGPGSVRTMDGHFVRSKSERDIANFLFQNRIPYQYERPTRIGGIALYPDFFLPDVGGGGLYLEHFGLTDDGDYLALAARKAQLFEKAGRIWIATDERDAKDMDSALRLKLGRFIPSLI